MPTSHSFGLPLVLLKPLGATRPLSVSDAPVSLADIPRTVTSLLDIRDAARHVDEWSARGRPSRATDLRVQFG